MVSCANRNKTDSNSKNQPKDTIYSTKSTDSNKLLSNTVKSVNQDSLKVVVGKDRVLENYAKNLEIFERLLSKKEYLPLNLLEGIIPTNEDEYLHFYMLSSPEEYPESNLNLYWAINSSIKKSTLEDKGNCLYLYLNMAEFVDGEYADAFFIHVPILIDKHKSKFCNLYIDLSERSKYRLRDFFDESCE